LLKRYKDYDQQFLALIPQKPTGGKGKGRLEPNIDMIIEKALHERYLITHQTKISLLIEEIISYCTRAGLKAPSSRTIRRRLDELLDKLVDERDRARHTSKQYASVMRHFPTTELPHKVWPIDHTPVDLIIVDEVYRKPIGRPYLTLAIDVYSRCIPGFCLTLDAPIKEQQLATKEALLSSD
jgi:putative transposase